MSYAIFKAAGQQFRAEEGRVLRIPLLEGDPGAKVTFDEVLLSSDGETIKAGQPTVKGAKVVAEVVQHGRAEKLTVFRFKRRKNVRVKNGHRQGYTHVRITGIEG